VAIVFEGPDEWKSKLWDEMTIEQRESATSVWKTANAAEQERLTCEGDTSDVSHTNPLGLIRLRSCIQYEFKLKAGDLHDACMHLGCTVPSEMSLLSYFHVLYLSAGHSRRSSEPQHSRTNTVNNMKAVLKVLSRGGRDVGGISGKTKCLSERIATVLNHMLLQSTVTEESAKAMEDDEQRDAVEFTGNIADSIRKPKFKLHPLANPYAVVPEHACVDAAQAESALGHNPADDLEDEFISFDKDVRAEENSCFVQISTALVQIIHVLFLIIRVHRRQCCHLLA
jgi:hypothetical protein